MISKQSNFSEICNKLDKFFNDNIISYSGNLVDRLLELNEVTPDMIDNFYHPKKYENDNDNNNDYEELQRVGSEVSKANSRTAKQDSP